VSRLPDLPPDDFEPGFLFWVRLAHWQAAKPRIEQLLNTGAAEPGELSQTDRLTGSYVATTTFWAVWKMACSGASANAIHKATNKNATPGVDYVNRDKASVIVKAVRADLDAAREALRVRELPHPFTQTSAGVRLPPLRSK
jgi:hypothetical protein